MAIPPRPAEGNLRAFFALSLCTESLMALTRLRDRVLARIAGQKSVRPVTDASMHLTLKFLGDIPLEQLPAFSNLLQSSLPTQPLAVELGQLIAFGSPRRARVLAVELQESTGGLLRAAQSLENGAHDLGIAVETRAFVPHITLARLREPQDLRAFLEGEKPKPTPIRFDALLLYQSELTPQGSKYHVLARQELA